MSQEGQRGLRGGQLARHKGSKGFGLGPAPLLAHHVASRRVHGHGWDLISFPLGPCKLPPDGPSRGPGASQHHTACSGEKSQQQRYQPAPRQGPPSSRSLLGYFFPYFYL